MASALRRIDVQAVAVAAVAALVWLLAGPRTPDLAAQSYRVTLFLRHGFTVWDNGWYGGMYVPDYSVTFPAVGALVGMRVAGALAAPVAAYCFARLAEEHFGRAARAGILWFAAATVADLAIGRLAYAWGAALALAALLAALRVRWVLGGVLAAVCAATSPLAGLMLAGVSLLLGRRRASAVLAGPSLAVLAVLSLLFGEASRQPFGVRVFLTSLAMGAAFVIAMPPEERRLRAGGVLFLAATVVAYVVSSPVGDNLNRAGAMLMGPLLACALLVHPAPAPAARRLLGVGAVALLLVWQVFGPVREVRKGSGDVLASAAAYRGLTAFLAAHAVPAGRLEVPFTTSHWESAVLAPRFPLARGWEKQLDAERDPLFGYETFTPARYEEWLRSLGVRYVALADVPVDPTSRAEVTLLRRGAPFLREVWHDRLWRVFEVLGAAPLASPPATVTALRPASVSLQFAAPGSSEVRVRWTPYWSVAGGCVEPAGDGFTRVSVPRAGGYEMRIAFSLGRVLSRGRRCTQQ
jgi:hypothetical protein